MKAFPVNSRYEEYQGMDLRDYFAGKAMQTMDCENNSNPTTILPKAINAYRWADAMIEARQVQKK